LGFQTGFIHCRTCSAGSFLFHLIPGITETATHLPPGAPLLAGPEAPQLQAATGILFLLFLILATKQVMRLGAGPSQD
jgi:hypothetical protein